MNPYQLKCRDRILSLNDETVLMGIVNVTPDSFSDGGKFTDPDIAVEHALQMTSDGAAIIDIGGESTRPGSTPISPDEQIKRTVPVIKAITSQSDVLISIDTTSSIVAAAALDAGAHIINDISALRFDPAMADLASQSGPAVVLMHMLGDPQTMQKNPTYNNVVNDVFDFLKQRIDFAVAAGIDRESIIADPGIGFGKTLEHNLQLLKHIPDFHKLNVPILIGPSRKAFIGQRLDQPDPADRLFGTAAACAWSAINGVHILRVHDVKQMADTLKIISAIQKSDKTRTQRSR